MAEIHLLLNTPNRKLKGMLNNFSWRCMFFFSLKGKIPYKSFQLHANDRCFRLGFLWWISLLALLACFAWEQGWRSGDCTHLPPTWSGLGPRVG